MGVATNGEHGFATAVRTRLDDLGRSQRWLGERVAEAEGRAHAYAQGTVAGWLADNPPEPPTVFAMEQVLGLKPGTLSRILGYLPVDARSVRSVPDAIDADPGLTEHDRRMLHALYHTARSG